MTDDPAASELLRDVVAFTALPAVWVGAPLSRVAASLAAALHRNLPIDAVAVVLKAEGGVEEAREGDAAPLDAPLAAWREGRAVGDGTLVVGVGPLGSRGVILARAERLASERVLVLRLAANLADTALREAELDRRAASAREQLLRLEKLGALGQLVSGVAHELRTPLTYANNSAYLVKRRLARSTTLAPGDRAALEADLDLILEAHERIQRTVGTLRHLASPRPPGHEPFHLSDAVAEAARLFSVTNVGPVRVVLDLQATGIVRGDRVEVQQVVLNLLQNASEAMTRGGTVRVRTLDREEGARLVIEDDGPGIPAAQRGRIFDPFYTTKASGTGLGLSIVRRILEAHGGRVVVGDAESGGARFEVVLPRPTAGVSVAEPTPAERSDGDAATARP